MPIDPTPISDYDHWNEEAPMIWWEEVGKHAGTDEPYDPYEDDAYYDEAEDD